MWQIKGRWALDELERLDRPHLRDSLTYGFSRFGITVEDALVLDFGCGSGASAIILAEMGAHRVVGVDVDGRALQLARLRATQRQLADRIELHQIIPNDPLDRIPDASLDVVLANEVFEHIAPCDRPHALRNLVRKLGPGGALLISSPNRVSPVERHTSGLPLINWLPPSWAVRCAQLVSPRCRGASAEQLVSWGLIGYSWFQAAKALKGEDVIDLARTAPVDASGCGQYGLSGRMYFALLWPTYGLLLRHIAPWDAWQPHLRLAFRKP